MDQQQLTRQAVAALKIDVPIMRSVLEGPILILYLYGGRIEKYTLPDPTAKPGEVAQASTLAKSGEATRSHRRKKK
jgi:hypothetical protein